MAPNVAKAFDFAQETTNQLLSLSSAILTITVAFQKNIVGRVPIGDRWPLKFAWVAYLSSILRGLLTLMNLAGNLEKPGNQEPSIYRGSIRFFSTLQVLMLGVGCRLCFGLMAF